MYSRYDPLNDLAEQQQQLAADAERRRQEAEAERQRTREEQERAAMARFAEMQRYLELKQLEETQRKEREREEAERRRSEEEKEREAAAVKADLEKTAVALQVEQERQAAEAERQRITEAQEIAAADLKLENGRYAADERALAERSLKIREDESHHPGRMRADLDLLWEREERRLEEEKQQIIDNEPDNFARVERFEQHEERMYEAWLFPDQCLARQQEEERQQLAASPVQTLATQEARRTEETRAPAAAKSAAEIERDKIMADFDRTYAASVVNRSNENERDGGREMGR